MTQVLVVDDSLSVRKALETILRPLAYTVRMAESGEAALSALAQEKADLVVADVLMPGMTGFELCQQLKASSQHAATPVILISGIVSEQEQAQAKAAGALGLVKKPFRADDLIPVVKSALQSHQTAAQVTPVAPAAVASSAPVLGELLDTLLSKQGILSALVLDGKGQVMGQRGMPLPNETTLGAYLRFFTSSVNVFATHLSDEASTVLIEFGGRALLLSPIGNDHTLAVVLRDAGAATVAKFVVKGQRTQLQSALQLN